MASSLSLLGESEAAKAGIIVMPDRWDRETQRGIIRVSNKHLKGIMASLTLINNINEKEVIIRSLGVSGTLKKAGRFIAM